MLWFERQLVATMTDHLDKEDRKQVCAFVAGSLAAMPQHLRLAVGAESVALGAWAWRPGRRSSPPEGGRVSLLDLETSTLNPVRQYARLMRTLVHIAEYELEPGAGG